MFYGAAAFNSDISAFDVSSVTDMRFMFYGASEFNSDISAFDVSSVTNMNGMFQGATAFNQNLGWCVGAGIEISDLFQDTLCNATNCSVVTQEGDLPCCVYWML